MRRSCRGFTLVEVLLAILIGSLLLTTIYGIFSGVSSARNRLEAEGDVYHQVRIFYDRLGSELRSLRLIPVGQQAVFKTDTTVDGDPVLEFSTELVSPLLQQHGGISRVRYELRRDSDRATLYRSEQVLLADLAPSEALPFIEGLTSLQFRYFQQGRWQEQWPGSSPPEMVEVVLELEVDGRLIPFRSSFVLPRISG